MDFIPPTRPVQSHKIKSREEVVQELDDNDTLRMYIGKTVTVRGKITGYGKRRKRGGGVQETMLITTAHVDIDRGVYVDHMWVDRTPDFIKFARMGDVIHFDGEIYLYNGKFSVKNPRL